MITISKCNINLSVASEPPEMVAAYAALANAATANARAITAIAESMGTSKGPQNVTGINIEQPPPVEIGRVVL